MFSGINNSKETIRGRMLKHAMNYWNIKSTEDLDPIVKLILEALSTELYNLGNDIKDTEVRLLEKIANLLAPDFLTCPDASHAIMHALPLEPQEILTDAVHFYTQKKISSKLDETLDKSIDVFFTPVENIKLYNAGVAAIVTGNNLFAFDASYNKQLLGQANGGRRAENNTIWIGVNIDERISSINDLFFLFDWRNSSFETANLNYQLLPLSKWYINDEEILVKGGLPTEKESGTDAPARDLSFDYDLLSLMEKDAMDYYRRKFITLTSTLNNINDIKQFYPANFADFLGEQELQKLDKKLLWIKIIFPSAIQQDSLDETYVYTNSFPVMNRQLNDSRYRLRGGSNIIPLKTGGLEQFLSVRSLSDHSNQYKATPFRKMEEEETGTYTLRRGGIERFDERNAKEFISYLLELLRSESAAFSAYGSDFIASTLREMNQQIALMEQKTKGLSSNSGEIPHYIIVKPYDGNDMMYAEYWTTFAETANGIRSGTKLQEYSGTRVKSDSLFLLTTTTGGKNRLKPEERVNAFRYGLITRNRIVTKEDIRNLCFFELGNRISSVKVEKGFEMSAEPQQGFFRTIDITLTASSKEKLGNESWQLLLDQLRSKLQNRSGMSNHYRIVLNS